MTALLGVIHNPFESIKIIALLKWPAGQYSILKPVSIKVMIAKREAIYKRGCTFRASCDECPNWGSLLASMHNFWIVLSIKPSKDRDKFSYRFPIAQRNVCVWYIIVVGARKS